MDNTTSSQDSDSAEMQIAQRLVYFAAERTLMAWIRTALGLMALGFVVDRFGLVLRTLTPMLATAQHSRTFSFWGGAMLIILGAVMALVAAIRYWLFAHKYHRNNASDSDHGIMIGVIFTLLIALLGFLGSGYLLFSLLHA